jgi:hypothetical protein
MDTTSLKDRADAENAPAWIPEKAGDFIAGRLDRIGRGPDRGYGRPIVVTFGDAEGEVNGKPIAPGTHSLFLFGTALVAQFRDAAPKVAEAVIVKYLGEKTSPDSGRTYKSWRVLVDRPEQEIEWGNIGDDGEELTSDDAGGLPVDDTPF